MLTPDHLQKQAICAFGPPESNAEAWTEETSTLCDNPEDTSVPVPPVEDIGAVINVQSYEEMKFRVNSTRFERENQGEQEEKSEAMVPQTERTGEREV